MDRRRFLQNIAVTTAALPCFPAIGEAEAHKAEEHKNETPDPAETMHPGLQSETPDTTGHTLVCEFTVDSLDWKVYEDLRQREGAITFLSSRGARVLRKSAEAAFAEAGTTPYLGLDLKDIGMASADLLADRLLQGG